MSDVVKKETGRAAKRSARLPLVASERKPRGPVSPSAERRAEQTRRVHRSRPVTRGETQCCIVALDGPLTQVSECIRTRDTTYKSLRGSGSSSPLLLVFVRADRLLDIDRAAKKISK